MNDDDEYFEDVVLPVIMLVFIVLGTWKLIELLIMGAKLIQPYL